MKQIIYDYKLKGDFFPRAGYFVIVENDELAEKLVNILNTKHSHILSEESDRNFRTIDVDILGDTEVLEEIKKHSKPKNLRISVTVWTLGGKNTMWSAVISSSLVDSEMPNPLVTKDSNFVEVVFTEPESNIPKLENKCLKRYFVDKALEILKSKGIEIEEIAEVY